MQMEKTTEKTEMKRYGPYDVFPNGDIIDSRTGRKVKRYFRKGKYVVGLRVGDGKPILYKNLSKFLYEVFHDMKMSKYTRVIPIDGDEDNLCIENLKAISPAEYRALHPIKSNRKTVSAEMMEKVKTLYRDGLSYRKIAAIYEVSTFTIYKILKGKYKEEGGKETCE